MSAVSHPESQFEDLEGLLACPSCDMLLNDRNVAANEIAACPRCHTVIEAPRPLAMTRIIMLSFAALILLFAALFFPFLELQAAGMMRHTTLLDTIAAFSGGLTAPLTLLMGALIVFLPLVRFVSLVYVLAPMAFGWAPLKHAIPVFRLVEALRPWAMIEIFMVGVAVALVKVAGLAHITIGPAFWAFVALVIVTVFKDNFMSRVTVWKTLEARRPS
ncbi:MULTISPECIES: paraquat-inducible protein A [Maritimibacter]|uniref:Paraquat-inducible protein A n=1 Tax=Maritimibacter alkaliphilus HTCC2654 TaxID=314271 RepID=A3VJY3_9RHOB|nr:MULTISPECIES: paraquat-inducible protein A [Maritimibacter]EAQ11489.1 Paraquat-inducible protein A [Rhodobacterales bacterium HTCC2654] [Maritimibacter alkaliphilus HTCC2654]MBL6426065.1 paraquat-inducible protein A [Maritimibacter sp.]TYP83282.1 paraquat-inducible protein A [Maritimibacter alkaliphilus HTCC2654]